MVTTGVRPTRSFWYSAAVVLLFNGTFLAWLLFKPGSHDLYVTVDDAEQTLGWFLAAVLCFVGLQKPTWSPFSRFGPLPTMRANRQWVPLLLGIGCFNEAIGQAIYTYYEHVLHQLAPFPSWADSGFLGGYPFLLLGIMLLPTRPITKITRSRVVLDGFMIMTAVFTFSWYFILGPTMLQGDGTVFAKIVGAAYPFFDLVMISCVLLLSSRATDASSLPAVRLLCLALLIIVITDTIYDYQTLQNTYATGGLVDLGWPLGYMLIGLAVQALRAAKVWQRPKNTANDTEEAENTCASFPSLWHALLPYALVLAAMVLTIYSWHTGQDGALERVMYLGGAVLVVLVLLRQVLAFRETINYNNDLRCMQQALQTKNLALSEANARLKSMATTDPLTGLPNHRALLEQLKKEFERTIRSGRPLSIVFFDGDRFKRVNDTYGHSIGDIVLRELGERVSMVLRAGDTLGRYGGEEFMLILPETQTEAATLIAERMRANIAACPFAIAHVKEGINTTISVGIASYPGDGLTSSEVLEQADQAMYWAKRLGRNQVRTAAEALMASRDATLASTIYSLERYDDRVLNGMSTEEILRADQLGIIYSLMWLNELRDHGMSTHAHEVSDLATAIAQEMGLNQKMIFGVSTAGLLHDIGKIAIPDGLLHKTENLLAHEWALIKQHPELGAQILEINPLLRDLMPAIRHHHERWDGTGYPDQLAGLDIPLEARIIGVAEAYYSMVTDHPYRARRTLEASLDELRRYSGIHFDPAVVEATCNVLILREEESGVRRVSSVLLS